MSNPTMEHSVRQSRWIIVGWAVVTFAFWCCIYVGIADLEAQYKLEDRV